MRLQQSTRPDDVRAALDAISNVHAAVKKAVDVADIGEVLGALLAHLVGITVELARRNGQDVNLPITIDGGKGRDITIHPPKDRATQKEAPR